MTRLASIECRGLKARDRCIKLAGRDAILGEARSGKSTLRYALTFLATGKNPEVGDTNAAAGLLMRGNVMTVRVTWDDESWAERTLTRKGKSLTQSGACSWAPEDAGPTETLEEIRGRFGATDVEAVQNLDLTMFSRLTGPKQAEAVNALLDASGSDVETTRNRLAVMTALRIVQGGDIDAPDNQGLWQTVLDGALAQLDGPVRGWFGNLMQVAWERIESKGLSGAITWAKGAKTDAQGKAMRKTNARAEIEDREGAMEAPAATLDDLNTERQALTDRIAVLRSDLEAHERNSKARDEAVGALERAQEALDEILKDGDPHAHAAELRQRAQDLRAKAGAVKDPPALAAPDTEKHDAAVTETADMLEKDAAELSEKADAVPRAEVPEPHVMVPVERVDAARNAAVRAEAALEAGKADPWVEAREIGENMVKWDEASEAWGKRLLELAEQNGADLPALEEALAEAKIALLKAEHARDKAQTENDAVDVRNKDRRKEAGDYKRKADALREQAKLKREEARKIRGEELDRVDRINAERRKAYRDALMRRAAEVDDNVQVRQNSIKSAEENEQAASTLIESWTAAAAAVAEAQARLDGMESVSPLDTDLHEAEIATADQAIARIDEAKRAVAGADARKVELSEITAAITEAQAESKVAAALAWALPKLRDQDLADRIGPILSRMSMFLEGSGMEERPFLVAAKGNVSYGWATGANHPDLKAGERIDGLALSGAEGVLFRAAFWTAIVGLRSPHTQVLALEVDDCPRDWASRLLAGIDAVDIPNALILTNRTLDLRDGWSTHNMDARTAEASA